MSDCRRVVQRLWEFLDGELPRAEAQEVRQHLAECEGCNPQYKFQLRFLNAVIRAYAARELPPPEFARRLRSALEGIGDDLT